MFPRFRVVRNEAGNAGEACGSVTATTYGNKTWVGDGWLGYLMTDMKFIYGRWHRREDFWGFAPDESGAVEALVPDSEWVILDGYWGERAELVLDSNRQWHKARFEPSDAVRFKRAGSLHMKKVDGSEPAEREVVAGGWDHEHCAICWETLGPSGQPEGYLSQDETWVCERCYNAFVQQRSLDFIPSA